MLNERSYSSDKSATVCASVNFASINSLPATPYLRAAAGSRRSLIIAPASEAGSDGLASNPVFSFKTLSVMPPTCVATVGHCMSKDSIVPPRFSLRDGWTETSRARNIEGTSDRNPVNITSRSSASSATSSFILSRYRRPPSSQPEPTSTNFALGNCCRTSGAARIRSS